MVGTGHPTLRNSIHIIWRHVRPHPIGVLLMQYLSRSLPRFYSTSDQEMPKAKKTYSWEFKSSFGPASEQREDRVEKINNSMHWELVQDTLASLISVWQPLGLDGFYVVCTVRIGVFALWDRTGQRWFSEGVLQRGVDQRTSWVSRRVSDSKFLLDLDSIICLYEMKSCWMKALQWFFIAVAHDSWVHEPTWCSGLTVF